MAMTQEVLHYIDDPDDGHIGRAQHVHDDAEGPDTPAQAYDELVLSRPEKARALLQRVGTVFKVVGVGYKLGSHQPLPDSGYTESRWCRVTGCTSHHVTLEDTSNSYTFVEPLANVTIALDRARIVPHLVVAPSHRA